MIRFDRLALLCLAWLLAALQPPAAAALPAAAAPAVEVTQPAAVPTLAITPLPAVTSRPTPTQAAPPVRLAFDEDPPAEELDLRPPLYDLPWAIQAGDHFLFQWPIAADRISWIEPNYRYGDYFPDSEVIHTGIDIEVARGTPVLAAGPGKVVWAGYGLLLGRGNLDDPYGQAVVVRHDFGYGSRQLFTVYAHLDRIDVKEGQYLEAGDPLGLVGSTGNVTGPHLHFEVRVEQNAFHTSRNPELWIAPPQGYGVLAGRITRTSGLPFPDLDVFIQSLETGKRWQVRTYGPLSANGDDFYRENLALGDLPAGRYQVKFYYNWSWRTHEITIQPGMVNYFTYSLRDGFVDGPPNPAASWSPPEWSTP